MIPTTRHRPLSPTEALHASVGWSGTYSVVCHGELDHGRLAQAFTALCDTIPMLRAEIVAEDGAFTFRFPGEHPPTLYLPAPGEVSYEDELVRPLAPGTTVRLTVLAGTPRSEVVLVLHHSIADAGAGLAVFARLWELYTDAVNGTPLPAAAPDAELPPGPEEALFRHGRDKPAGWDETAARIARALTAGAGMVPLQKVVATRTRLREQETRRVTAAARAAGLSVHALVTGCVLSAYRDELHPGDEPSRIVCGTPVDLRGRLVPPVPPLASTNVMGNVNVRVDAARNADPVVLGKEIGAQMDAGIAAGEPHHDLLDSAHLISPDNELVDCVVSNLGVLPVFAGPPELTVTDFRGFQTTTFPWLLLFVVSSQSGRLSVDLVASDGKLGDDQRERIVGRIADLLNAVPTAAN